MMNIAKDLNMTAGDNKGFHDVAFYKLAAVKAIVEGHGGRVVVKSEPGKGSVFTVVLPKARDWEEESK